MSSLLTSSESNGGVLCGRSYTSSGLVLFGSIFVRIFGLILSAFELYHIVERSTIKCPLPVFGVSLAIKGLVQSQFQFIQN